MSASLISSSLAAAARARSLVARGAWQRLARRCQAFQSTPQTLRFPHLNINGVAPDFGEPLIFAGLLLHHRPHLEGQAEQVYKALGVLVIVEFEMPEGGKALVVQ